MALINIPTGARLKLQSPVYKTASDAYHHRNPKSLVKKYWYEEYLPTKLHSFGGAKCVAYIEGIGFFAASQVMKIIPAPATSGASAATGNLPSGYASKNFKFSEFYCGCGGKYCNRINRVPRATWESRVRGLAALLEKIRAEVNRQYPLPGGKERVLKVMSGTRCATHNRRIGGAGASYHMSGKAADISVPGVNTGAICRKVNTAGGVGTGGGHFPHVDTRGKRERWTY